MFRIGQRNSPVVAYNHGGTCTGADRQTEYRCRRGEIIPGTIVAVRLIATALFVIVPILFGLLSYAIGRVVSRRREDS